MYNQEGQWSLVRLVLLGSDLGYLVLGRGCS